MIRERGDILTFMCLNPFVELNGRQFCALDRITVTLAVRTDMEEGSQDGQAWGGRYSSMWVISHAGLIVDDMTGAIYARGNWHRRRRA